MLKKTTKKTNFWQAKRVYITGHTGFKGTWLCSALLNQGASVKGYALTPVSSPNMFSSIGLGPRIHSEIGNILDAENLKRSIAEFNPEFIFHLAAQPLVRESYHSPSGTFSTNVMGTVNLLEAAREITDLRVILNVTTDKVYENVNQIWGYRESDSLGGHDPYSASKACSEIVTASYSKSFMSDSGIGIATARSGNVIGGGDWSKDRLVPDILRAIKSQKDLSLRYPYATRPWQHVIEPIQGYLALAESLYEDSSFYSGAWNFGPEPSDQTSVLFVAEQMIKLAKSNIKLNILAHPELHEALLLSLDITKSVSFLDWKPKWNVVTALRKVFEWHDMCIKGADMFEFTSNQLTAYASGET